MCKTGNQGKKFLRDPEFSYSRFLSLRQQRKKGDNLFAKQFCFPGVSKLCRTKCQSSNVESQTWPWTRTFHLVPGYLDYEAI
jgi:hypothetical protein